MKQCTKCKQEKPFAEFGRHTRNKDGLDTQCKKCRRAKPGHQRKWIDYMMRDLQLGPKDY